MGAPIDELFTQAELVSQDTGHGRSFLHLTSGLPFTGTMHLQSMLDANSDLGADPREAWQLEVILPGPAFVRGDRFKDVQGGSIWEIAALPNPSYITQSYEVVLVENIDA